MAMRTIKRFMATSIRFLPCCSTRQRKHRSHRRTFPGVRAWEGGKVGARRTRRGFALPHPSHATTHVVLPSRTRNGTAGREEEEEGEDLPTRPWAWPLFPAE